MNAPTASSTTTVASGIRSYISRYVWLSPEALIASTLWVLHTWAFGASMATPYLVVLSPTKQSGKTRFLEVLERVVRAGFRADGLTEAVLFRVVDAMRPTLLLDEMDGLFASALERTEPLRAVLNAGNRAGGVVARCVPPTWDVHQFSVFCPKAVAGIDNGRWPDTLLDRSVVVRLMRRAPGELVDPFRFEEAEADAKPLRDAAEAWASEHLDALREARPEMPDGLSDRACDGWEPLLAIADLLGGEWPSLARGAAVTLFQRQEELEDSVQLAALRDVREVFEATGEEKLPSSQLCAKLRELPDSGWATFGTKRGSPGLRPADLAMLLRPFEVKPRSVRVSKSDERGSTLKGYVRAEFEDVWHRYLSDEAV